MTLSIKDRKLRLIQEIINLDNEQSLAQIEKEVGFDKKESFWAAIKPIKKTPSIEEMIEEQGYIPIHKKDFYEKLDQLDIKEPLDELLLMLSK